MPPATALHGEVLDHLRARGICFAHAFSGNRRRQESCRWKHDPFPPGHYRDVTRAQPGGRQRRRFAPFIETQYDFAVNIGLLNESDDLPAMDNFGADDPRASCTT